MKYILMSLSLFVLTGSSLLVSADSGEGKILHDQSCGGCHDSSVYTREDKRIKSYDALLAQVSRCKKPAGAEWTDQETRSVVDYLNSSFYHFK